MWGHIRCILMIFLLRRLFFILPIILLLLPFPTAGLKVLPDLGNHREGAMQLLFQVGVLVLQLRTFELQFPNLSSCLRIEGLQFVLGFGLLLQSLDEEDDTLALFWGKVAEQVASLLPWRHSNIYYQRANGSYRYTHLSKHSYYHIGPSPFPSLIPRWCFNSSQDQNLDLLCLPSSRLTNFSMTSLKLKMMDSYSSITYFICFSRSYFSRSNRYISAYWRWMMPRLNRISIPASPWRTSTSALLTCCSSSTSNS